MNAAVGTSQEARVAVMGDLHLSREIMQEFFCPAREDIQRALGGSNRGGYIVQVGDLGAYEADPGSTACFEVAKEFLDGFEGSRVRLVTGNHDLEGSEFNTGNAELDDATNLGVWTQIFGQKHYWTENVGDKWLLLGLSTTRFRSNSNSCHEVFIDEEQRTWFERQLDENARMESPRKVAVFTHAPPAGCGLRVLHSVHVKNRCSWLNHSDDSVRWFMELLSRRGDNVALWMSGHFHMSHDYVDSISVVGGTTFVQCGVIGTSLESSSECADSTTHFAFDQKIFSSLPLSLSLYLRCEYTRYWGIWMAASFSARTKEAVSVLCRPYSILTCTLSQRRFVSLSPGRSLQSRWQSAIPPPRSARGRISYFHYRSQRSCSPSRHGALVRRAGPTDATLRQQTVFPLVSDSKSGSRRRPRRAHEVSGLGRSG